MPISRQLLLTTSLATVLTAPALAGPAASLTTLGANFYPLDMSADASIILGNAGMASGQWTAATGLVVLQPFPGTTFAYAVSGDGSTIVGTNYNNPQMQAFALRNGTATVLDRPSNWTAVVAYGTNTDGSVIVGSVYDGTSSKAVTWSGANWSTFTELGSLVPTGVNYALATNGNGAIAAGFGTATAGGEEHTIAWQGTTPTDLGAPGFESRGYAISYDGSTIVGEDERFTGSGHATAWSGAGFATVTDLGTLGGTFSEARDVSADGSIIVGSAEDAGSNFRAFRYANGVMSDLSVALTDAGVDLGGSYLETAGAVSADGRYIAAVKDNSDGVLVYYDDGIGAITDPGATQASVDQLNQTRNAVAVQSDAYFGALAGSGGGAPQGSSAEAFGLVGSAVGGVKGTVDLTSGWSVSGGLAAGTSAFGDAGIDRALYSAVSIRYDTAIDLSGFTPFGEVGGGVAFMDGLRFNRPYAGGVGVGTTNGTLGTLFGRLGAARSFDNGASLALSGELGARWLQTGAYAEATGPANPFPIAQGAGTTTSIVGKLAATWSAPLSDKADLTIRAALGANLGGSNGLAASTVFGAVNPNGSNAVWAEGSAKLAWHLDERSSIDLHATAIAGGAGVGTNAHVGAGYSFSF